MKRLIGIDGGGTGCRAKLCDSDGNTLGIGHAGPANIMTNLETAQTNILQACNNAYNDAKINAEEMKDACVYLGLAGANIGNYAARLAKSLPFQKTEIVTDAEISLEGAVGSSDGAAAIIGTGSVFIYRAGGKIHTVGGWGFTIGDLASGSRLGRALLQETLLAYDNIHTGSDLTNHILKQFENDPRTIVEYAHTAKPDEFGTFAPLIFEFAENRDPIAREIVRKAVSDIEETLEAILVNEEQKFCMLGGLGSKYINLINSNLQKRVTIPLGDAVDGAVSLARKHLISSRVIT